MIKLPNDASQQWGTRRWLIVCILGVCCASAISGGQRPQSAGGRQAFDSLAARANKARESGQLEEAVTLYRQALNVRPKWSEGWWYLATLLYDRDRYEEAARAFKQAALLQPKVGAAWAMLGLCEFQLGQYDDALMHIRQGRQIGFVENPELSRVMRFHESAVLILKGEYETAQNTLSTLSNDGLNNEGLIITHGLAVLRIPVLPKQINAAYRDREMIRRAGWAEHLHAQKNFAEAQREYERLAMDFPKTPNVQYAYARFLTANGEDDKAIAAFQREIENSPNHALARFQIAYIKLRNKQAAEGVELAEQAVKLHPRLALGRYLFGRLLFDVNQNERAIAELEAARGMTPNDARIHFVLARAYARANRKIDADKARETFTRLNRLAEEAAARGVNHASAIEESPAADAKPQSP